MDVEKTLSIIKPDAVKNGYIGEILSRFEKNNLNIVAIKMISLTVQQAQNFYSVHKNQPFFVDLVTFMCSGPVVVQVLEGIDAVAVNRKLMGATDPKKADSGTIRSDFAESIDANAVHGSDSLENASEEISFFFADSEISILS